MNLSHVVERWAREAPERIAFRFEGRDISYAALWQRIEQATSALAGRYAVRPGDRIAWLGWNDPQFVVMLMALARLSAIAVPLNARLAPAELAAILAHSGARLLFCATALRSSGDEAARGLPVRLHAGLPLDDANGAPRELPGRDGDVALLVYTSGTTGQPKGAPHTQANLRWNMRAAIDAQDITAADQTLCALPMFHVGGLCIQLLPTLCAGGTVSLHARFEPGAWLGAMLERRPTLALMVPATMRAVLEHLAFAETPLDSLRMLVTGSAIVPPALIEAFHARGVPVTQVYGATETGPVSIVLRREDAFGKVGSAGRPALQVQARLVGSDGSDVPPGEVGEIWLRGPNVVRGYWNDTHHPAFADGWFKSGDLARVDADGCYWVVGRSTDMIISGGENIHPAELENVLAQCPKIAEAVVIGVSDARWGEVAVAVLVRKPGVALDEADVLHLFEGRIARYKHPRRVCFVDALPKTALGKVQKGRLRSLLESS